MQTKSAAAVLMFFQLLGHPKVIESNMLALNLKRQTHVEHILFEPQIANSDQIRTDL